MKLHTHQSILLLILFVTAPFLSFNSFCNSSSRDFETQTAERSNCQQKLLEIAVGAAFGGIKGGLKGAVCAKILTARVVSLAALGAVELTAIAAVGGAGLGLVGGTLLAVMVRKAVERSTK